MLLSRLVPPDEGEVVVVWATPQPPATAREMLDSVEKARLSAFVRDGDRARYATGCWLVRNLVAKAIGTEPSAVEIDRSCTHCGADHGRPRITANTSLGVSVTHAGARVGVALAHGARPVGDGAGVGLDVCAPGEWSTVHSVASSIVADEEAWAATLEDHVRLWVAKEAVLKAIGLGLAIDPTTVVLTPRLDGSLRLVEWPVPVAPADVHMLSLDAGEGHTAALAWIGSVTPRVRQERISGP